MVEKVRYKPTPKSLASDKQKLIVSDFSLDFWQAQTWRLDLHVLQRQKPEHLSKDAYEQIKK
jgi:hypothetical protein